jgi:hypothetical protein
LHALATPPAFILSQDQTLKSILFRLLSLIEYLQNAVASVHPAPLEVRGQISQKVLFYLALYQKHISRREKYVKEYMSMF